MWWYKAVLLICNVATAWCWGYSPRDQHSEWPTEYPLCRSGSMQSPVAIYARRARPLVMPALKFVGYRNPLPAPISITNTGKSAVITIPTFARGTRARGFTPPYIYGGPLSEEYQMESLHFHWGDKNNRGAEHTLNGVRMPLEMHIVHRNKKYPTPTEALNHPDGLCVLAIFFQVAQKEVWNLEVLTANLTARVVQPEASADLPIFALSSILRGLDTEIFYTYKGSLTTPPCSEAVTWIIFPDYLSVSLRQLERFRSLLSDLRLPLVDNFRQLQFLNGRRVFVRKRPYQYSKGREYNFEDNFV